MKTRYTSQPALWLTLTALLHTSSAQRQRDCPGISSLSPNTTINSTGTQFFQLGDPFANWYLTLTLNDTRSETQNFRHQQHDLQGWISAPADTNATACVYLLPGLNLAAGDGEWGCDGVLTEECLDFLQKDISDRMDVSIGSATCPRLPERELIRENCPDEVALGGLWGRDDAGNIFPLSFPSMSLPTNQSFTVKISNNNCSVSSPPGPSNSAIPNNYLTHPIFGYGPSFEGADRMTDNFTYYDRYVRQVRPWVVAVRAPRDRGVQLSTRVVCVAPDQVVDGSRRPVGEWPPVGENAGWMARVRLVGLVAGVVVALALA
jgi:hypothetical protein